MHSPLLEKPTVNKKSKYVLTHRKLNSFGERNRIKVNQKHENGQNISSSYSPFASFYSLSFRDGDKSRVSRGTPGRRHWQGRSAQGGGDRGHSRARSLPWNCPSSCATGGRCARRSICPREVSSPPISRECSSSSLSPQPFPSQRVDRI